MRESSSTFRASTQLHALARDTGAWLAQFAEMLPLW